MLSVGKGGLRREFMRSHQKILERNMWTRMPLLAPVAPRNAPKIDHAEKGDRVTKA